MLLKMNQNQNHNRNQPTCDAKQELEKLLERPVTSLDIVGIVKAYEWGCYDCPGYDLKCDYYKSKYLGERLG